MSPYTTLPWPTLCKAVACLNLKRLEGNVIRLPKAASGDSDGGGEGDGDDHSVVTHFVTADRVPARVAGNKWKRLAESRAVIGGGAVSRTRRPD